MKRRDSGPRRTRKGLRVSLLDKRRPLFYKTRLHNGRTGLSSFRRGGSTASVSSRFAGVAQLAEQLPCKQQVAGSNPTASSSERGVQRSNEDDSSEFGGVPERPKGADC